MGWFDALRREKKKTPADSIQIEEKIKVVTDADEEDVQVGNSDKSVVLEESPVSGLGIEDSQEATAEEHEQIELNEDISDEREEKPVVEDDGSMTESEDGCKTKIIAIINQKGGVGKSTTAINLSAALGLKSQSVLLIDLDPQGNATSGLGVEKNQIENCVYDVLLNDVAIEDVIVKNVCEGVDLVPATINLAGAEVELVSEMARESRLKEAVVTLKGNYDYVFIDCPPSLGLLTINALVGSDALIIPIQTEFYALEGVTKLLESMKRVKNRMNTSLDIFGILLTMYDGRTTLSRQVAAEVKRFFGDKVFETIIPRTVKLSEAPSYGIPICQYDPLGKGATSYENLAKEVIERG